MWELDDCKKTWGKSSIALDSAFEYSTGYLLDLHPENFISNGQLSNYELRKISDLSGTAIKKLSYRVINTFIDHELENVPSSAWLALASNIVEDTDSNTCLKALSRLLRSGSSKLANKVEDGEWTQSLYPKNEDLDIISGIIWDRLGSPYAKERWRAAHTVRDLAKFGKWEIISEIINLAKSDVRLPFIPSEFKFFGLHAKLWLLISLARISVDYPSEVFNYSEFLFEIIGNKKFPHVLMRHFAGVTINNCTKDISISLSKEQTHSIEQLNLSKFEKVKSSHFSYQGIHPSRPKNIPAPKKDFMLDLDFRKSEVSSLAGIFDVPFWKVENKLIEIVDQFDSALESMYESDGRPGNRHDRFHSWDNSYQNYGAYLGWHSLFLTAGHLLENYPISEDEFEEDPWGRWLKQFKITREDGLWLSDGLDKVPLDTSINLLEKVGDDLGITGDKTKLKSFVGLTKDDFKNLTVRGSWGSADGIKVNINSCLVNPKDSVQLIKELNNEKPFHVWLPSYELSEDGEEYIRSKKEGFEPWLCRTHIELGIDEFDPFGNIEVVRRPIFSEKIKAKFEIQVNDPFSRNWINSEGELIATSEAWGYEDILKSEDSNVGKRLQCTNKFISEVLNSLNKNLIILINLQRYEKGFGHDSGKFFNTVAVFEINKALETALHIGAVNKLNEKTY